MDELTISYTIVSPHRQEIRNKLQLIGASVCILLGYSETINIYSGIFIILPIVGLILAILNIIFVRFYRILREKYGDKFEIFIIRTNGIIMLLTGIGYQVAGSKYIQYAYYLLTILFFVILPNVILPAKKKRLVLQFTRSGIIVQKRFRTVTNTWQSIDSLCIQNGILEIKKKGNREKIKKYYLDQKNGEQGQLFNFIWTIKSENGYEFDLQNNCQEKK